MHFRIRDYYRSCILWIILFTISGYGLFPKFTKDYGLFRHPPPPPLPNRASLNPNRKQPHRIRVDTNISVRFRNIRIRMDGAKSKRLQHLLQHPFDFVEGC